MVRPRPRNSRRRRPLPPSPPWWKTPRALTCRRPAPPNPHPWRPHRLKKPCRQAPTPLHSQPLLLGPLRKRPRRDSRSGPHERQLGRARGDVLSFQNRFPMPDLFFSAERPARFPDAQKELITPANARRSRSFWLAGSDLGASAPHRASIGPHGATWQTQKRFFSVNALPTNTGGRYSENRRLFNPPAPGHRTSSFTSRAHATFLEKAWGVFWKTAPPQQQRDLPSRCKRRVLDMVHEENESAYHHRQHHLGRFGCGAQARIKGAHRAVG